MIIIRNTARLTVDNVNEIINHCASDATLFFYAHGKPYRARRLLIDPLHTAVDLARLMDDNAEYAAVVNRRNYSVWAVIEVEEVKRYLVAYLSRGELKHKWVTARNPDEASQVVGTPNYSLTVLKVYTETMANEFIQKIKGDKL